MREYPSSVHSYDHEIGGKMIVASMSIAEELALRLTDQALKDNIKKELAVQLAMYMLENNLLEFTQVDHIFGAKDIKCRAFLTPNDQVKILRTYSK